MSFAAALAVLTVIDATGVSGSADALVAESRGAVGWQGGWAAPPQAPVAPFAPNWSQQGFANQTVRQVVRVSTGGTTARIELSNRYLASPTGPATFHQFASATSYRAGGDHRSDRDGTAFTETSDSWYFLSGVEVAGGKGPAPQLAVGDSITDGSDPRWMPTIATPMS